MQCSVHKGKIKGKVHWWNRRAMCGRCYRYFTQRVHVVRTPPRVRQSTLLDRLRRWLG
jgi:hypothetical protein